MLSVERILSDSALFMLFVSAFLLLTFVINPRVWLQDYPEALRKLAPPLTVGEKRLRGGLMAPFLMVYLAIPFLSTQQFAAGAAGEVSFLTLFLHAFAVLNIVNLFDAVVIDWLFLGMVRPRFALIPEALTHPELLMERGKLFRDWVKGIGFCTVFGLIVAGAVMLSLRA